MAAVVEADESMKMKMKPHVAVLPSPGMGHIIPLLHFANRLILHQGFRVSFLLITTTAEASAAQNHLLRSPALPSDLHVINLPPVNESDIITADMPVLTHLCVIVQESLRHLRSVLAALDRPRALVIDLFCTQAFDACNELSIPVYSFFTASAALLALSLYLPTLDREVEGEFVDLPEPVRVPGCTPIRTEDLLDQIRNRKIDEYKWFLLHVSRLPMAAGIFANTWDDLEPVSLRALKENRFFQDIQTPPVHPIGPLIKHDEPLTESDKEVLTWLDNQPSDSVLFVALGSGGTLTSEQLTELALGLEMSRQRFILVARKPTDASASAAFFDVGSNANDDDPAAYLPEGFVRRTEGVGFVVPSWAPQVSVLRHGSTGGFLSHCGWNSTLESIVHGVPMIAWPLYAEQRMNATMLAEEVGVAAKPVLEAGKRAIGREEIERVVRLVMEGEEGKVMRRRVRLRDLQGSALKALNCDGSSSSPSSSTSDSFSRVAEGWKSEHNNA